MLHHDSGPKIEGIEVDEPEDISPEERMRRELLLARVMLVAADIVLAGDPLGFASACDLCRELRHCYPELVDEHL